MTSTQELNTLSPNSISKFRKYIALIIIAMGAGTIYIVPYILNTYATQIGIASGISAIQLQTLITIYGVLNVLFYIPGGWIADRFSTRSLFSISLIGTGIASVWYAILFTDVDLINYGSLVIIHLIFSVTTVLTFWSAFVKGIKLLGPAEEQARLYSTCDSMRNVIGVVALFTSTGLLGIVGLGSIGGANIFWVLLFYAIVYVAVGLLSFFFLPKDPIKKIKKKRSDGLFNFKDNVGVVSIVTKDQYKVLSKKRRTIFINENKSQLLDVVKRREIWMIAIVIFFWMNSYNTFVGYTGYFLGSAGVDQSTASYLSIVTNYVTPFFGALLAGWLATKKTKSAAKLLIPLGIIAGIIAIVICAIPVSSTTYIFLFILIAIVMLIIGGARGVFWSTMTEGKINNKIAGMSVGFISIIGFSCDIWMRPFLSLIMDPFLDPTGIYYTPTAFHILFGWGAANLLLAALFSWILFKRIKKINQKEVLVNEFEDQENIDIQELNYEEIRIDEEKKLNHQNFKKTSIVSEEKRKLTYDESNRMNWKIKIFQMNKSLENLYKLKLFKSNYNL